MLLLLALAEDRKNDAHFVCWKNRMLLNFFNNDAETIDGLSSSSYRA